MVVSDTHCSYETIDQQIAYAEASTGTTIAAVVHLGDFGLFKAQMHDYFIKKGKRFKRPLYCIDGNHEDFDALPKLVGQFSDFFTFLPRGSVTVIDKYRFLSLGGTGYMDAMITPRGALITDHQIEVCLSVPADTVDIIITHDCPTGIGVVNTPGMEHFGETGFGRSSELAAHFAPKLWFFGHHHQWFHFADATTSYYGVNKIWEGFGLLDGNFGFQIVKHRLEPQRVSLIDRILTGCRILHTDSSEK